MYDSYRSLLTNVTNVHLIAGDIDKLAFKSKHYCTTNDIYHKNKQQTQIQNNGFSFPNQLRCRRALTFSK